MQSIIRHCMSAHWIILRAQLRTQAKLQELHSVLKVQPAATCIENQASHSNNNDDSHKIRMSCNKIESKVDDSGGADDDGFDSVKGPSRSGKTDHNSKDFKAGVLERGNAESGPGQDIILEKLLLLLTDMRQVEISEKLVGCFAGGCDSERLQSNYTVLALGDLMSIVGRLVGWIKSLNIADASVLLQRLL
jgi:hypothetical protein